MDGDLSVGIDVRAFVGLKAPWRSTSVGEELVFSLLEHHRELPLLVETVDGLKLELCGRSQGMADFYVGTTVMNIAQRLVKLALDVREETQLRDAQIVTMRARASLQLNLTGLVYSGNLDDLARYAIECAEAASRSQVPTALGLEVAGATGGSCYSCGNAFGTVLGNGEQLIRTSDHVWPASLGGATTAANLLPACNYCNNEKKHVAVWQMCWLQPEVHAFASWPGASRAMPKPIKMALHSRAAMAFAHSNGSTLKDAFVAIGPQEALSVIDPDSGLDFFNMRVHDPERTGVDWVPA